MWVPTTATSTSTWPCSTQVLDEIFEGVPDADRNRITHDNVKNLYGI